MCNTLRRCLVCLLFLACWVATGSPLYGQDRKRYDDLMREAQSSHSIAVLALQVGAVVLGLGFFCAAYSTARKRFQISAKKKLEGPGASAVAAALVRLGLGVAVGGVLYAPTLGP
jgi:hypothetical protein